MAIARTDARALKKQYPHVEAVKEWPTQQSLRLLWDRIFDLEARLQANESSLDTLVSHANTSDEELQIARLDAKEALALAQSGFVGDAPLAPGEPSIPDYGSVVASVLATFDPVVPEADEAAGKAQLTRAVAWAIYNGTYGPPDTNIRLLFKDYGTEINDRSVDIVVQQPDGDFADVASSSNNGDGTVTIIAVWLPKVGDSNTTDESRWIVPTSTIAAESGPMAPA